MLISGLYQVKPSKCKSNSKLEVQEVNSLIILGHSTNFENLSIEYINCIHIISNENEKNENSYFEEINEIKKRIENIEKNQNILFSAFKKVY